MNICRPFILHKQTRLMQIIIEGFGEPHGKKGDRSWRYNSTEKDFA